MSEVPKVTSDQLGDLIASIRETPSDAIVLLATDLPTFADIKALEQQASRPVLSSNQVILWRALQACGVSDRPSGLGRLFDL
jgi:maleate isomerase